MADKNSGNRSHEERNKKTGRQDQPEKTRTGTEKDMDKRVSNEDMDTKQKMGSDGSRKHDKPRSDMGKDRRDTL